MDKRESITASNLGPVVSVLTWIVEASVIIAVGIKFTLSFVIPGKRSAEDAALLLATVKKTQTVWHSYGAGIHTNNHSSRSSA